MAKSSARLVRSFSPPPFFSEEKKENPLRALTASVSFGRFMSESLDWEKWSAFTHNRYLEEVKKFSKPGSVAEKKAYFEAHFKRRRAAALLKQQNAASDTSTSGSSRVMTEINPENEHSTEPELVQGYSFSIIKNINEMDIRSSCPVIPQNSYVDSHSRDAKCTEPHLGNDRYNDANEENEENDPKVYSTLRNSASSDEKKSKVSSVSLANKSAPKNVPSPPGKLIIPVQKTPESTNKQRDTSNKRRSSCTTSIHTSTNFTSCSGETHPVLPKLLRTTSPKKFKTSTRPQTSTRASVNGVFGNHVAATQPDYRNTTARGESISQSRTRDGKVQASINSIFGNHSAATPPDCRTTTARGEFISQSRTRDGKVQASLNSIFGNHTAATQPDYRTTTARGESISLSRTRDGKVQSSSTIKARSPTVPSSFTFKSDERAEKRKEFFQKLEQKLNSKDTEERQGVANPQVKGKTNFKDLLHSIEMRATKNVEVSRSMTKKIPTQPCLSKVGERASSKDTNSRPPWRISAAKPDDGWSDANKHSTRWQSKKSTNENASPNVQT